MAAEKPIRPDSKFSLLIFFCLVSVFLQFLCIRILSCGYKGLLM